MQFTGKCLRKNVRKLKIITKGKLLLFKPRDKFLPSIIN